MEAIRVVRSPAAWVLGLTCLLGNAQAQLVHRGGDPWQPGPLSAGPGLQPSRVEYPIGCGASLRRCEPGQTPAFGGGGAPSPLQWNLELSQLNLGAAERFAIGPSRQGLNLSLVGRRSLFGSSFSVYGKLGATYGYTDAASSLAVPAGAADPGYGLSFGAGLSMEVTPRLSATLGWDSHDLRLGGREGFRSTSLGLQYRY